METLSNGLVCTNNGMLTAEDKVLSKTTPASARRMETLTNGLVCTSNGMLTAVSSISRVANGRFAGGVESFAKVRTSRPETANYKTGKLLGQRP